MPEFTQKYTIVHLLSDLPDGFEWSMKDWPLHITLADVFAINKEWRSLFQDLESSLEDQEPIYADVNGEDLFGEDKSIKVKLLENTRELQSLHDLIISILEKYEVIFNSPQYTKAGFKPHSTHQAGAHLNIGDTIKLDSITLIDMFPNSDPYQRRVLGTIHFS